MPPTVYQQDRPRTVLLLLGSLAFVAGGAWLAFSEDSPKLLLGGIAGVVFFGAGAFVLLRRLANPEPELTITDEGFKAIGAAAVSWAEVRHVTWRAIRAGRITRTVIEVVLHDPAAYLARTSGTLGMAAKANQAAGFSPVNIPPMGRQASLQDVVLAMKTHHPALIVLS